MAEKVVDVIGKLNNIPQKKVPVFVHVFLYTVTRFSFQINTITFSQNAKNLGQSDDERWRKTTGWSLIFQKKNQYQGRGYIDVIFVSFKSLYYGRYEYRKIASINT